MKRIRVFNGLEKPSTLNVLGIIPARGGSKALPRKNLMFLAGKPLVAYAIASAFESKMLSRILVSTDDKEIADVCGKYGADVPFLRPKRLASDRAGMLPVMQHSVKWVEENEGFRPDVIVLLQPTTPFRTGMHIDAVIKKLVQTGCDSVLTVREVDYSPYFMKRLAGDRAYPLLKSGRIVRRQDAPVVYQPSGMVYATTYDVLMRRNKILGPDTRGVIVSREDAVNIDTIWDFKLAEVISKERCARK